jgi:cAMP-dependent protein kinase regulator
MSGTQYVNRSAQEHLVYIQEKVNPILEALVTQVLLERPEDPSFFMLKWLCEQTKTL